jgi:uncharacterized protein YueI
MHTQKEPVIFAVDLDETLYNSKADGIEHLVDMQEFFNAIKYSAYALSHVNKQVFLHIITAKTKEDDLVQDIRNQAAKFLDIKKLDVHCVGNKGNELDIAARKIQQMAMISQQHKTTPQNFIFIDDNACNIETAMTQDIICIHAHNNFDQNKENIQNKVTARTKMLISEIMSCVKTLMSKNRSFPIMPFFKNNQYNQEFDKAFASIETSNACKK